MRCVGVADLEAHQHLARAAQHLLHKLLVAAVPVVAHPPPSATAARDTQRAVTGYVRAKTTTNTGLPRVGVGEPRGEGVGREVEHDVAEAVGAHGVEAREERRGLALRQRPPEAPRKQVLERLNALLVPCWTLVRARLPSAPRPRRSRIPVR
jgi:hypothetical protein